MITLCISSSRVLYSVQTVHYIIFVVLRTNSDFFPRRHEGVLIIETEYFYCAVRTEMLNAIQLNFVFKSLVTCCKKNLHQL